MNLLTRPGFSPGTAVVPGRVPPALLFPCPSFSRMADGMGGFLSPSPSTGCPWS